ncbi:MAG TPA: type II toxin-antitoxin system RelE/ParE family toxin [Spirochaetota bacterium]|nr:type II toxin-antitoxin system RelE/ParE family toxin [Spirochaetota bacterium]HOQ12913.1 type II toxin-antitoxin system RelE/ParE family toxin [Spirochaetota bacterium]HOV10036.1 type II toxin-antitoxin system RelE/ParE family toxin [Spirochaetota bacterium]
MDIEFHDRHLRELYVTGKCRKLKFDKNVIKHFMEVMAIIVAAKDILDLWKFPGLNFEKLTNTERYSLRLNRQWRLEISITDESVVIIECISNHYG